METSVEFLPSGDTGLTVQFGHSIDRALSHRVVRLRAEIDAAQLTGVLETVPTYRSLTIHYDPRQTTQSAIIEALQPLIAAPGATSAAPGAHWRLPVCFDGDFAPDLLHVADWTRRAPEAVIEAMTAEPLYVYMIGFAPGQPYMGDLPDALAIPRRENPVARVPAGSVLIATGKSVIYPIANPTGWYVVGRTPAPIFDPAWKQPALLSAGDTVSLSRVDADEFGEIETQVRAGGYTTERLDRP